MELPTPQGARGPRDNTIAKVMFQQIAMRQVLITGHTAFDVSGALFDRSRLLTL